MRNKDIIFLRMFMHVKWCIHVGYSLLRAYKHGLYIFIHVCMHDTTPECTRAITCVSTCMCKCGALLTYVHELFLSVSLWNSLCQCAYTTKSHGLQFAVMSEVIKDDTLYFRVWNRNYYRCKTELHDAPHCTQRYSHTVTVTVTV